MKPQTVRLGTDPVDGHAQRAQNEWTIEASEGRVKRLIDLARFNVPPNTL